MRHSSVDIFQYTQYRPFFRAVYDDLKQKDKNFSFRSLQRKAGFSDRANHFWQILNGSVRLTAAAGDKYAAAFGLNKKEKEHLHRMIALEQAKSEEEKEKIISRMLSSSQFLSEKKYQAASLVMFSDWFMPVLYHAASLENFREDPEWISQQFFTSISPSEIRTALDKLLAHGFLSRCADGTLKKEEINMTDYLSASRETSEAIVTMRKSQIRKTMISSLDAMDSLPFEQRLFYSSSIPVSKELFEEMKQRVIAFQEDLRAIASKRTDRDAVYQFNVQFFSPFSE